MDSSMFHDRADAGRRLGALLARGSIFGPPAGQPLVLGLPRGGVPVGAAVARALHAPLDVLVVRKLGHPLQPELAIGAVATGGVRVLNREFADALAPETIDAITARETQEVERRSRAYRGDAPLTLRGRDVVLVDDGLATGATMRAAVRATRAAGAARIVVAVPVGDPDVCRALAQEADDVVCLLQPAAMMAVGYWYEDFPQLTDDDVRTALESAHHAGAARPEA